MKIIIIIIIIIKKRKCLFPKNRRSISNIQTMHTITEYDKYI
jgi:hypothetical protein